MLPAAMRRRAALYLAFAAALLLLGVAVAGCGEEPTSEVAEGEPLELGGLGYNVQITRFLNPDDTEDQEYLVGQPPLKPGNAYLGVFMVIENDTDDERTSASDYTVVDTLDTEYKPNESESPYALDIGSPVPAHGSLPRVNTTAQTGPNQGALLIFPVSDDVSDNRPLKLEIHTLEGDGDVILDI
jgi:hypothetical protein